MAKSPSKAKEKPKPKPKPPLVGLFVRGEDWAPIIFSMSPGPNRPIVRNWVNKGGGALEDPKMRNDENNRIRLADPDMVVLRGDGDVFSYKFVLDCVEQGRLLPNLVDYRLGKKSRFQDHDPVDVLVGRKTWNDLKRIDEGSGEACSDFDSDSEDTSRLNEGRRQQTPAPVSEKSSPGSTLKTQDNVAGRSKRRKLMNAKEFAMLADTPNSSLSSREPNSSAESVHFDSDSASRASPPSAQAQPGSGSKASRTPKSPPRGKARKKLERKPYTRDEEEAMLMFIVKNKRFSEIGGTKLWKYMEQKKLLKGRSWQSMKERFRKKVLPNLDYFDVSDSDKEALNERR